MTAFAAYGGTDHGQKPQLPKDDPFWQRMQAIWAIPNAVGAASDYS